jgi:hypothetical protein
MSRRLVALIGGAAAPPPAAPRGLRAGEPEGPVVGSLGSRSPAEFAPRR